jgi:antitoxin MazE
MKIHTKIQKWGNSLALRISGSMRKIPHFKEGTEVDVEITEKGFTVVKTTEGNYFPFKEVDLIKGLSAETGHADLLASLKLNEHE